MTVAPRVGTPYPLPGQICPCVGARVSPFGPYFQPVVSGS